MVAEGFLPLNGLQLHYREWPGGGRPLLLLHGLASTCHIWDLVAPQLAAAGHRVVALDQRGHGQSDKPDDGYDFATIVADDLAAIESLELTRPVVIGHSWGGNVAVELAAARPEAVSGLVLIDGGFSELQSRPGMTWERAEQMLAPPDLSSFTWERFVETAKQWSLGLVWSPEVEAAVLANFEIGEDGRIRPRLRRDRHMRIVRALWEQRVSQLFPRVHCPVLLLPAMQQVEGRMAEMTVRKMESVERALSLLARGSVVWLEDAIHDVPLQRPDLVANLIIEFAQKIEE